MPELPLTALLERQALNELARKDLWEVLSRVMLGRDLVEEGPINERKNMSCLYDICLLHSLGRAFIC
jgi:hypothetical protein